MGEGGGAASQAQPPPQVFPSATVKETPGAGDRTEGSASSASAFSISKYFAPPERAGQRGSGDASKAVPQLLPARKFAFGLRPQQPQPRPPLQPLLSQSSRLQCSAGPAKAISDEPSEEEDLEEEEERVECGVGKKRGREGGVSGGEAVESREGAEDIVERPSTLRFSKFAAPPISRHPKLSPISLTSAAPEDSERRALSSASLLSFSRKG